MKKEKALELWDIIFGAGTKWHLDCFGVWMFRDDYGEINKKRIRPGGSGNLYTYGWEIDHIRPIASFNTNEEANFYNNFEPMHFGNNREKSDNYPHFVVNNQQYRVVRCDLCGKNGFKGYGIINEKGERVDWKGVQQRYFRSNK